MTSTFAEFKIYFNESFWPIRQSTGAGAMTGGLLGALTGLGMPEYEAKRYEGRIKKGGILLSVHCDNSDWVARAKQILESTGAHDIASSGEAGADFAKSDKPLPRAASY